MDFSSKSVGPEAMHRGVLMLVKQGVDPVEAYARFESFSLTLRIELTSLATPADEVFLLTAFELARRIFLGGVTVVGELPSKARTGLVGRESLRDYLGSRAVRNERPGDAEIVLANGPASPGLALSVRGVYQGWTCACVPARDGFLSADASKSELAAVAAAALCVAEAFFRISGLRKDAGVRAQGLSLWHPEHPNWREADLGPTIQRLPNDLLVAGLGHLGQAYLWTLAALGYDKPSTCAFWLQDFDRAGESTPSTSVLTEAKDIARFKTRIVASWLEERGYNTRIIERPFTAEHVRLPSEPSTVLCGFDNVASRRMLLGAGHQAAFEAGLGSGPSDFHLLRCHTLPQEKSPDELWPSEREDGATDSVLPNLDAYGIDECGKALLGGKAVGVPFVGMFASSLLIADILRRLHGGTGFVVQDVELANLRDSTFVPDGKLAVPSSSFTTRQKCS